MNSQRFLTKIDLKLEAVTCPGVWLCSHGYLEVTIKALGYFFRTGAMEPYFPLLCHDHFKMEGYFKNAHSIAQLMNSLAKEHLEITLWQNSRRLASYKGVLMDLLQYIEPKLHCPHKNTRQLLMKATPAFPGIIAPKVEITTHLFIKDKLLNLCKTSEDIKTYKNILKKPINKSKHIFKDIKVRQYQRPCAAQTATSEDLINRQHRIRQQKAVCHTRDLQNSTKKTNDFLYRKPQERCVSIASNCSSNNSHTSVGICDIEHDSEPEKFINYNHAKFCELCRLYKKVFLT